MGTGMGTEFCPGYGYGYGCYKSDVIIVMLQGGKMLSGGNYGNQVKSIHVTHHIKRYTLGILTDQ